MKRKASATFDEDKGEAGEPCRAPPRLDGYLLAEEILPRLPVRAAAACAGGTLRGILTGPDYWLLRNRRLPRPNAACLVVAPRTCSDDGGAGFFRHEFHYADAAFPGEPAVVRASGRTLAAYCYGGARKEPFGGGGGTTLLAPYRYAGTCNGLVLLTSPWDNNDRARGVLFNPATGEEETIVLDLACGGGGKDVFRCFCGFGYSPSSKTYKALVCARDFYELCLGCAGELVVVPFCGAGAHGKPRTVAKVAKLSERCEDYFSSLSLDGKVYVLPDTTASAVLAFDVDDETVAHIPFPWPWCCAGHRGYVSELMEVWGRPCIAMGSTLWNLTPGHQWERRCTLAAAPRPRDTVSDRYGYGNATVHGAWDCGSDGDGLLFMLFGDGRGFMYDLGKTKPPGSLTTYITCDLGESAPASMAELPKKGSTLCWGYQPTLVPPAAAFRGYVCPEKRDGLRHFSSGRRWLYDRAAPRCLEELVETMQKRRP